jgi:hypothetical protein
MVKANKTTPAVKMLRKHKGKCPLKRTLVRRDNDIKQNGTCFVSCFT